MQTIILFVVLYVSESGSVTLREEHRLRVFENRVLRGIFGPQKEEVAGGWRRLPNEELHNLYASLNIIRVNKSWRMRWAGHILHMGDVRNSYYILVVKRDGKTPLGRPRCRWENNIGMDLREIEW
jgi:hypothetical protein